MSETTTHWKKAFNKEFLGSHDLNEGEELKLVIKKVEQRLIKDPQGNESWCNVGTFTDEKIKPMIFNVGACKQIQRFSGQKYIENWKGVAIQVYVQENVKAFGELVDALRIREFQPTMEKPKLTKGSENWDKAVESYKEAQDKDRKVTAIRKHYELSDADLEQMKRDAA